MTRNTLMSLARVGALVTIAELEGQVALLRKAFPVERPAESIKRGLRQAIRHAKETPTRRRKLSAKGRAAIVAAQKRRWAKKRGGKK